MKRPYKLFILCGALIFFGSIIVSIAYAKQRMTQVPQPSPSPSVAPSPSPSPTPTLTPTPQPSPTPTPSPSPHVQISSLQSALNQKFGTATHTTIDQRAGSYAQGTVTLSGYQKWWLATKITSNWQIVAEGTSYVNCGDVRPYHFPKQMVPVCWNGSRKKFVTL